MVVSLRTGWQRQLRMQVEILSGVLGFVLGVRVLRCIAHNLSRSRNFLKNRSHVTSTCFRIIRVKTRADARGNCKCVPDIEVSKSTVVCDYRCAHLSELVRRGYLLSREASRHKDFGAFVIPSCVGLVSFRVS